ncbi:MAG: M24 family metallopeptidase [Spirochaetaceae bacterium]
MRLTPEGSRRRRSGLLERVQADLIVISNPRNVLYYTGFRASELSLGGWGPAMLAIDARGESTLITHNFATGGLEACDVDRTEVWTWYDPTRSSGTAIWRRGAEVAQGVLGELLADKSSPRIGYEAGTLPVDVLPPGIDPELLDITDVILMQRRQKHPDEVALIRRAVEIGAVGHETARKILKPGMTEIGLYAALLDAMTVSAGEGVNLISDVLSGPRCREGSGAPSGRVIEAGDSVILDLNPYVDGYRSDYTSTLVLRDELTAAEAHAEKTLHEALRAGEALLRPGNGAASVYKVVDHVLHGAGYSEGLLHHAGHGLGLGHPEAPYFVPESDEILMIGDIVTLEPGVYGEEVSARIEHNYLITESGFERLSGHETSFLIR